MDKELEKRIRRIELWQEMNIGELNSISDKHSYYSSFSLDARKELESETKQSVISKSNFLSLTEKKRLEGKINSKKDN